MPTGYTADVVDGKMTDPVEFVISCAHAFGAMVHRRDEGKSTTLTLPAMSTWHLDELAKAKVRLDRLKAMGDGEADEAAVDDYEKACLAHAKIVDRYRVENARLEAMRKEIATWEPPTPDHTALKSFMFEQLDISTHTFDYLDEPVQMSGDEWLAREIIKAERDIEYHREHFDNDVMRHVERVAWIRALADSLGVEVVDAKA